MIPVSGQPFNAGTRRGLATAHIREPAAGRPGHLTTRRTGRTEVLEHLLEGLLQLVQGGEGLEPGGDHTLAVDDE